MASGGDPGAHLTVHPLDFEVAVIDGIGKMSRCALRHTATKKTAIEHHNRFSLASQEIGGCQTGNSGADNAYICLCVGAQRRQGRCLRSRHP
jgi:hypothetical protein